MTTPTRRVRDAATLELALTAIMLFLVVTATRWLMGTIDSSAGGWWNTPLVIVAVAGIGVSHPRLEPCTPWAVGTMITAQILAFGTRSGAVANPARQFGPAVLSGTTAYVAVYLIAPVLGALAATVLIGQLTRHRTQICVRAGYCAADAGSGHVAEAEVCTDARRGRCSLSRSSSPWYSPSRT